MPSRAVVDLDLGSPKFDNSLFQLRPKLSKCRSIKEPHALLRKDNLFLKRVFDIIFSVLILFFLLSWMVPLLAILILIDSRGPIFFSQQRHGRNSREFQCLKFRTMIVNVESDFKQAKAGDPRITRFGKIMRKYNLDELPQFINVIRGDMSIVGPRPHMVSQTLSYEKKIDGYRERLLVKPGISGLAQVNGSQGPTPTTWHMKKRIRYDLLYIRKWSFWMDLKIVVSTIPCSLYRSFHK